MTKEVDKNQVNEISGGFMPGPDGDCIPQPGWPMPSPWPFPDPFPAPPVEQSAV